MAGLLIDEDLPRSLAPALRKAGFVVTDVRDAGLRGKPDLEILKYAGLHALTLVSSDLGFSRLVGP